MSKISAQLLSAVDTLNESLAGLSFSEPVTHVYNPLEYAGALHRQYIERFGATKKRVLLMGMNPGPWGMAQSGVPFGEIDAVKSWMKISGEVTKPANEHPKRPIVGLDCERAEVSGRRLWGLFGEVFPNPDDFFANHYVCNYCPLVWMEETGRNRTPDKLPAAEMAPVGEACDAHLRAHIEALKPEWIIGVGAYAETRAKVVLKQMGDETTQVGRILHPSPASPAANRDWAGTAEKQLREMGIWEGEVGNV